MISYAIKTCTFINLIEINKKFTVNLTLNTAIDATSLTSTTIINLLLITPYSIYKVINYRSAITNGHQVDIELVSTILETIGDDLGSSDLALIKSEDNNLPIFPNPNQVSLEVFRMAQYYNNSLGEVYLKDRHVVKAVSVIPIADLTTVSTIDAQAINLDDRVLLTAQATSSGNGIYIKTVAGLVKPTEYESFFVFVLFGSVYAKTIWINNSGTWSNMIGTKVQAYNADLSAIAALTGTSGFLKKTATNTWSFDTAPYTLPVATTSVLGGIKIGTGLTIASDVVSITYGSVAATAVQGNDPRVTADQAANVASIRTLGTGSTQAAAGNHNHGNYMVGVTAGTGISITHTPSQGSTATIANLAPNVTTDITITHAPTTVTVNSSDGTDGTINSATTLLAGVMSAADKTKLDGIAAGAASNINIYKLVYNGSTWTITKNGLIASGWSANLNSSIIGCLDIKAQIMI